MKNKKQKTKLFLLGLGDVQGVSTFGNNFDIIGTIKIKVRKKDQI